MTPDNRQTVAIVVQSLQLIMLVIGVAGVFVVIGNRDQRLSQNTTDIAELKDISGDLLRTSVEATTSNRDQDRRLDELRDRLRALEVRD